MRYYCNIFWKSIENIYQDILNNPFVANLANGNLKLESFQHYICQDSLYLIDFSRSLALAAVKSETVDNQLNFLAFAKDGLEIERILHSGYLDEFNIIHHDKKTATCELYTSYLLGLGSYASFEELVAALLPCFWIYSEVGKYIYKNQTKPNKYQKWIDTYAGEDFDKSTQKMLDICETIMTKANEEMLEKMQKTFIKASKFEHLFWKSSYDLEPAIG